MPAPPPPVLHPVQDPVQEDANSFLDRFVDFVSKTYNVDKAVKLVAYSLSTVAQVIKYRNGGEHTELSEGLANLYGGFSNARIVFRMQGTLEAIWEMRRGSGGEGWQDPRIRPLAWAQAFSNIFYHPFEDVAWAGSMAPKLIDVSQDWWWARSDWAWLAYCILDMYMNVLKGRELRKLEAGVQRKLRDCGESEIASLRRHLSALAARRRRLALQQLRMVFYLPNAVHWAFIKPPLHQGIVAVLGLSEAVVGTIQAFPAPKSST